MTEMNANDDAAAPASNGGGEFVNPLRAYEETLTRDELLKRLDDQARIIHELYTGKHGVIPHPSEVYQAGTWEIYKVDEHQGHAERVGDVGALAAANSALEAERQRVAVCEAALKFYADEENYALKTWDDDVVASEVQMDKGYMADNALTKAGKQ